MKPSMVVSSAYTVPAKKKMYEADVAEARKQCQTHKKLITTYLATLKKGQPQFETLSKYMSGSMNMLHLALFMDKTLMAA